jgi:hypothetical protein
MIALIASVVFLLYVLVPGGIFRSMTSRTLPLKKFHKTRAQDVTFAVVSSVLPFWLAVALVWYVFIWPFPTSLETLSQRREAYRTVFLAMDSDKELSQFLQGNPPVFWSAVNSVLKRQGRFLFWFYVLVVIEAFSFSKLARSYRKTEKRRLRDGFWPWAWQRTRDGLGDVILPPTISEWHVLLTDFATPGARQSIEIDVMSVDGILYQGRLKDYFFDVEGELAGILLSHARRFDREEYLNDKKADLQMAMEKKSAGQAIAPFTKATSEYWEEIPGADLFYIPKERISNINVRHVRPPEQIPEAAQKRLADRKITDLVIEQKPEQRVEQSRRAAGP